jgi:glycoside/pentoside/hexuronide:cation symporter, GPH family
VSSGSAWQGRWQDGLRYGALGFPLAFVALPLYVVLPNHYASVYGVPLASLGLVLLGARLLDALLDPWIGRFADHLLIRSSRAAWQIAALACVGLALGFYGLFAPPAAATSSQALLSWCAALLALTYLSYSLITVIHQAWGTRLGGTDGQQARIIAWREALGLLGVLVASILPVWLGVQATSLALALALVLGILLLRWAPAASARSAATAPALALLMPLQTPAFRRLLGVYLVNGIASAVPATLVLFFINDRLQAPQYQALFLGSYFAAGALSMPLWLRLVTRIGLARSWLVGMVLTVLVFIVAAFLGTGDVLAFALVCVGSGVALGADLCLPSALLAGVIAQAGHAGRAEGAYLGWWHFATKLNLALAAGLALPLLALLGYAPGQQNPSALAALSGAYCVLPCLLKLIAIALLASQNKGQTP